MTSWGIFVGGHPTIGYVAPVIPVDPGNPQAWTRSVLDDAGLIEEFNADRISGDAVWTRDLTDPAGLTDDAAFDVALAEFMDGAGLSDTAARDIALAEFTDRTVIDDSGTDLTSAEYGSTLNVELTDTAGLSDGSATVTDRQLELTDQAGTADTTDRVLIPGATAQPRLTMTSAGMVQRSGANYRKGGINAFQIVNNDYPSNSGRLMSNSEIDSLLDKAVALKVGVLRAHTMGANIGPNASHLVSGVSGTGEFPTIAYRQAVWDVMDYVVKAAGDRGLYLMVPLTDELAYYHGGKRQWVNFRRPGTVSLDGNVKSANSSTQRAAENYFFTDQQIVWDYRQYTRDWLNHVNSLTGVAYKNDPTIAILETGNELWTSAQDAPAWAAGWAQFVKSIAPNVLVADGAAADGAALNSTSLDSIYIDIVGTHPYTTYGPSNITSQAIQAAAKGKAYHIGEYPWSKGTAPSIEQAVRDNGNIFTSMPWSLQNDADLHNGGPGANYGTDDASFYVPGSDATMQAANTRVTAHSQALIDAAPTSVPPSASGGTAGDITDTFDTAGAPNSAKWIVTGNSSQATTVVENGQVRLRTGATGGYGGKATLISAATARVDQRVVFDVIPADLGEAYFQVSLRSSANDSSIGDVACYRMEVAVSNGSVSVTRRGGGAVIAPGVTIPGWAALQQVHFDYSVIGSRIRVWAWTGTTRPTSPLIDVTNTEVTAAGYAGFVLNGGNAATSRQVSIDNFSLTSGDPASGGSPSYLYEADLSKSTVAAAHDFNYVNSSYASMGSLVSDSSAPDGAGKVFRTTLSAASQGYRAHNELRLVAASSFPRSRAVLRHQFRFTTLGSLMQNDDAKVGYGFVGAPDGADNNAMSYGGTKLATSWTERMTICRPGYLSGSDPGGLSAYLYAEYAAGQARGSFGIRVPYKNGSNAIIPTEGRWYDRTVEVVANTPGQNNGVYRVWIDGVLVVNLTDVQWNPSGNNILVGYLMTQSFPNATLTTSAVFDQSTPVITATT